MVLSIFVMFSHFLVIFVWVFEQNVCSWKRIFQECHFDACFQFFFSLVFWKDAYVIGLCLRTNALFNQQLVNLVNAFHDFDAVVCHKIYLNCHKI